MYDHSPNEGNERLGRLLSEIILVRSGYTFFGEDSVSAVIAKSGLKYFDSIAKIIRSDNGGDLTYFLEYYLSVLSSYADNNRYKRRKHESEIIRSEQMLASEMMLSKCSEGDISHEAAIQDINQKNNNGIVQGISNKLQGFMMSTSYRKKKNVFNILIEFLQSGKFVFTTSDISEHCKEIISAKIIHSTLSKIEEKGIIKVSRKPGVKNYYEFVLTNKVPRENGTADDETYSYDAIYNEIDRFRVSMSENSRRISAVLIDYLKSGKMTFTMADLKEESGLTRMNINNFIRKFILSGMILHNDNGFSFNLIRKDEIADSMTTSQYVIDNYSSEVLLLVHELCTSTLSTKKDRRIGNIIRSCFEKGIITAEDYDLIDERTKMNTDMIFACQLGLVESIGEGSYRINSSLTENLDSIEKKTKNALTILYRLYGESEFSVKMVIADLDYSKSHVNATLHRLTWLKVLDCKVDDNNRYCYQFLITPEDHPECFGTAA